MKITIDKNLTYLGIVLLGCSALTTCFVAAVRAVKNASQIGAVVAIEGRPNTVHHSKTINDNGDATDAVRFMAALERFEAEKAMRAYKGKPTCENGKCGNASDFEGE